MRTAIEHYVHTRRGSSNRFRSTVRLLHTHCGKICSYLPRKMYRIRQVMLLFYEGSDRDTMFICHILHTEVCFVTCACLGLAYIAVRTGWNYLTNVCHIYCRSTEYEQRSDHLGKRGHGMLNMGNWGPPPGTTLSRQRDYAQEGKVL